MSEKTVNSHHAKTQLSRLIARAGKPVAELRPAGKVKKRSRPLYDPLLRVEEYRYDGANGPTANEHIDRTVYDI